MSASPSSLESIKTEFLAKNTVARLVRSLKKRASRRRKNVSKETKALVIIVNLVDHDPRVTNGAANDTKLIRRVHRWRGDEVKVYRSADVVDEVAFVDLIERAIQEFQSDQYTSIKVYVTAHGCHFTEDCIELPNEKLFPVSAIKELLFSVPKVYPRVLIFNTCRGYKEYTDPQLALSLVRRPSTYSDTVVEKAVYTNSATHKRKLPSGINTFEGQTTARFKLARLKPKGSLFITEYCKVLHSKGNAPYDIINVWVETINNLWQKHGNDLENNFLQTPLFTTNYVTPIE